jgi:hypothetical protein
MVEELRVASSAFTTGPRRSSSAFSVLMSRDPHHLPWGILECDLMKSNVSFHASSAASLL